MTSNHVGQSEGEENIREYVKIVDKFTGMHISDSPLKHDEVVALDKMRPYKFYDVQFKSFSQQREWTNKAFKFCATKNGEARDTEPISKLIAKQVKNKKKKGPHLKKRKIDDNSVYNPRGQHQTNYETNWSFEMDMQENNLQNPISDEDFLKIMTSDPNISQESSITLEESAQQIGPPYTLQDQTVMDDFDGKNLSPAENERLLLDAMSPEIRRKSNPLFDKNRTIQAPTTEISSIRSTRISEIRPYTSKNETNITMENNENCLGPFDNKNQTSKSPGIPLAVLETNKLDVPYDIIQTEMAISRSLQQPEMQLLEIIQPEGPGQDETPPVRHMGKSLPQNVINLLPEQIDDIESSNRTQGRRKNRRRLSTTIDSQDGQSKTWKNLPKKLHVIRFQPVDLDSIEEINDSQCQPDTSQFLEQNLKEIIRKLLKKNEIPPRAPLVYPIPLRPSGSYTRTSRVGRVSSNIVTDVQNSQQPIATTMNNVMHETEQRLHQNIAYAQESQNELIQIQRELGFTHMSPRAIVNQSIIDVPITVEQQRELQSLEFLAQQQQIFVKNTGNDPEIALEVIENSERRLQQTQQQNLITHEGFSDEEKCKLSVFGRLLDLYSKSNVSQFSLKKIMEECGNSFSKIKITTALLDMTRESVPMIELVKADYSAAVTHLKLFHF
uniref:CSON008763 protein n=1 Tax=Culicoides sonorensis TaxID=179676 RepID=A0A336MWY7_CULSO